jgi:cytidylate kinase
LRSCKAIWWPRDKSDSTRSVAPLAKADDAVYIDTTLMPIDAVVNRVLMLVLEKLEA